jgi:hypothetical protein
MDDEVTARVVMLMDDDGGIGIETDATLGSLCAFSMFLQAFVLQKFTDAGFEDLEFDDDETFKPGGTVQ